MTITTARPTTDEILLNAATAPARATMHTSKVFARHLGHNSLFRLSATGQLYRSLGTPFYETVGDNRFIVLDLIGEDRVRHGAMQFDINATVHGVVGAI